MHEQLLPDQHPNAKKGVKQDHPPADETHLQAENERSENSNGQ